MLENDIILSKIFPFLKTGLILFILDSVFISLFMVNHFNNQIILVQGSPIKINIIGSLLSYFFLTLVLFYFIINEKKNINDAFILGLCVYGVYEYTTMAILQNWLLKTTIIDTLWGGTLFALTTYLFQI